MLLDLIKVEHAMNWLMTNPFAGNLTYLLVAAGIMTRGILNAFLFRPKAENYIYKVNTGTVKGGTIWLDIANMIGDYGSLAIGGIAFIFQLLSMLGIAVSINVMVWVWGVGVLGSIVSLVTVLFQFLAFDKFTIDWAQDTTNANKKPFAAIAGPIANLDMTEEIVCGAFASLWLWQQSGNWMAAQWDALSEEDQAYYVADLQAKVEAMEAEWLGEMEEAAEEAEEEGEEDAEDEGEEGEDDAAEDVEVEE